MMRSNVGTEVKISRLYTSTKNKLLPISDSENNIVDSKLFEHAVYFISSVSSNGFVIDLKYLIAKLQTAHGSRTSFRHQGHKNAFVYGLYPKANFAISIFTQHNLSNAMGELGF